MPVFYLLWAHTISTLPLLFRDPDASQALKCAVRWESAPCYEPVSYGPGQRYAAVWTPSVHRD